ncbi:MAG: major facilitator superfamily 1 [Devosia sp.]|uniref:MFS transporter n=1 Tax=Devosia sp. TaxID=1871048 RepID=UPI002618DC33|nr:MFS transporter [Devosia sp.]MDB5530364.1 major facilitator superfamily 1 [Devosia sp.]
MPSTTEADPALIDSALLRQNWSYRHFISSRVLSSLALNGVTVAVGWLIYDQTNSAFALGLVGLVQFLPVLVLTFVVGQVADRYDRRRIGLICQLIEAVTVATMALGVWQGWLSTTGIYVGMAVLGCAIAFERPTMAALLPGIVPASMLQRAIATSTSFMQGAIVVGPALGGLLYGVGPVIPFAVSALFFAGAAFNVIRIQRPATVQDREPVTLQSVFAGVGFIKSRPIILGTLSLDLFAVLLGGITSLLPIFARDILHAGPWALGFLRAAPAIGAFAMSIWLARHRLERNVGRTMLIAVAVFGVATIIFALSTNIILSVALLVVLGASDTVSVVIRSSLVQLLTPDAMRGRVNAVNSLFIGASNQLGEFESGMVAGLLGPVGAGIFGGVGTIVIVLAWARMFPALRKVQTLSG